jgi:hypothetical protein
MMSGELLVRSTAWLSGVLYVLSLVGWWRGWPVRQRRMFWTMSWLIFLIHVGLAFHVDHAWSHQEAWRHTERQSGFGHGIYFNYAVLLLWSLDVAWWWVHDSSYHRRSPWITWSIHGFLLFMWINAAVVFPLLKWWS